MVDQQSAGNAMLPGQHSTRYSVCSASGVVDGLCAKHLLVQLLQCC
jgi:hypothetical protein